MSLSGVYEIPIILDGGEKVYYIGMTKRKFDTRLDEHKAGVKYNRETTALAKFCSRSQIKATDYDNAKIIWPCTYPHKSLIRESMEIELRNGEICNDGASCYASITF